ncbi:MAG: DUF3034 family protein [Candidatus Scalindua sp.]|jgi:hypothetical protein|nr:DUF3034 family protein [Candidatus Scalindua sp.]MBT6051144.1 DUF3034 family protein [Candidatus Scalindua sp.]
MRYAIEERLAGVVPPSSKRVSGHYKVLYGLRSTIRLGMKRTAMISCLGYFMLFMAVQALFAEENVKAPPLPLQNVEGFGGILITGSAYLINPSEEDKIFGLPALGVTYVNIGDGRHMEAFTVSETLWGRFELGYALNHFGLGKLPEDIEAATGVNTIEDSVYLHNFNARLQLLKEDAFKKSWIPALTVGLHYKHNDDTDVIDRRLGGAFSDIEIKDNNGVDVTLFASKMIKSLPRPLMLNAGVRSTEAAQIGLFGFTEDRRTVFEGNFGVLVLDNLVVGGEYRQKPDEFNALPGLVEEEDDWWDSYITYIASDNLTMSIAFASFGDVFNHEADDVWGIKFKWEF